MKAFEIAGQSIMLGKSDVAVAVGIESMTQAPYLLKGAREGHRMGDGEMLDSMLYDGLICAIMGYHMGNTAENLAEKYNISRQEQDELALLSHQRAVKAIQGNIQRRNCAGDDPVEKRNQYRGYGRASQNRCHTGETGGNETCV